MLKEMHNITCDNRRILIIDDNLSIHEDYRKVLATNPTSVDLDHAGASLFDETPVAVQSPSFELSFADQGQLGFHMVERAVAEGNPYAVAFVDMRLPPGWDGLVTIEQIWKADPNVQVVICTAFSDHPWHEIAARLGKTDRLLILRKPFDAVEVEQLAVSLTCKWELAKRARLRIDCINGLVDLRYKELLQTNAQLEREVASRTAALSNRDEQFHQLNEQLQQFVGELRRMVNTPNDEN